MNSEKMFKDCPVLQAQSWNETLQLSASDLDQKNENQGKRQNPSSLIKNIQELFNVVHSVGTWYFF